MTPVTSTSESQPQRLAGAQEMGKLRGKFGYRYVKPSHEVRAIGDL